MDFHTASFSTAWQPVAEPAAMVTAGSLRFTLLTDRLIRLEYSPGARFEDRPSQAFWNRRLPVPAFETRSTADGHLEIETAALLLRVRIPDGPFSPESLSIRLKERERIWRYGDTDSGNLGGTARTLDDVDGAVPLQPGLVSRSGWTLVDDSRSLVFDENGWITPRYAGIPAEEADRTRDLYFFGYGRSYTECVSDFVRISGSVPLIPRWILGNWWSRYWEYTRESLLELMQQFHSRNIPLSVCIVDMDWHLVDNPYTRGWTGYTWNRELFPEPEAFLRELHGLGLRTALNLHPADGVHPHEERYAEFARFMGRDPTEGEPLLFDISDPRFVEGYFRLLHHPLEDQGVDFWWMDWQQGRSTRITGLDPLWWLNHLHFHDLGRDGRRRPFIFSRWAGLGSHRYPIGFSGDTHVTWDSLAFQPEFTAAAANVGFGWWSHDIGGHFKGTEDPELYARWIQYGLFSPVLRVHSSKNPFHLRAPWLYDRETEEVASDAMRFRHRLVPYLYTMARRNSDEGIPPVTPLYWIRPDEEEAYRCPDEYRFGTELIAAPFTSPRDPATRLARREVWLPEGEWFDLFTGKRWSGSGRRAVYGGLRDIPVFAHAGAIVPLDAAAAPWSVENPEELEILLFPGADGEFTIYEDDGSTTEYLSGGSCTTRIIQEWQESRIRITVFPPQGDTSVIPENRRIRLTVRGIGTPDRAVRVVGKNRTEPMDIVFDPANRSLAVPSAVTGRTGGMTVSVSADSGSLLTDADDREETMVSMLHAFRLDTITKSHLLQELRDILTDPSLILPYAGRCERSQIQALWEIAAGRTVRHRPNREPVIQTVVHPVIHR